MDLTSPASPTQPRPTSPRVGPKSPWFTKLEVTSIVEETPDAISIVFDVPDDVREAFAYRAGQFVTLRLPIRGEDEHRSYSMSSAPEVDAALQVTLKRVADGLVSNWIIDNLVVGDHIEVSAPSGLFVLEENDASDIVAFAAGSGITPVFSLLKSAVAATDRQIRLLYANRNRASIIFDHALHALEAESAGRLAVHRSIDDDSGYVQAGAVAEFLGTGLQSEFYVCGPQGFMDMVITTLVWCGARSEQLHVESFTPDSQLRGAAGINAQVTMTFGGKTTAIEHRADWTLVHTARAAGLRVPSSCHLGQCGTCLARVTEGRAEMTNNQVLSPEEVEDGWILTCQAKPVTPLLSVVYE